MKLTKTQAEKIFSAKNYEEAKKTAAEVGYALSEKEDAELKKTFTHELSDDDLEAVAGGRNTAIFFVNRTDKFATLEEYHWEGGNEDGKYLCPNCGRPLHKGTLGLFYCDPCDESWFSERYLKPNLENWTFGRRYIETYDIRHLYLPKKPEGN